MGCRAGPVRRMGTGAPSGSRSILRSWRSCPRPSTSGTSLRTSSRAAAAPTRPSAGASSGGSAPGTSRRPALRRTGSTSAPSSSRGRRRARRGRGRARDRLGRPRPARPVPASRAFAGDPARGWPRSLGGELLRRLPGRARPRRRLRPSRGGRGTCPGRRRSGPGGLSHRSCRGRRRPGARHRRVRRHALDVRTGRLPRRGPDNLQEQRRPPRRRQARVLLRLRAQPRRSLGRNSPGHVDRSET